MKKFFPPLGNITHWITQTYHRGTSNPASNLAIDVSSLGNKPCYAVDDGEIVNATPNAGGYLTLDIGQKWWVLYVHTHNWLPIGTKVKRGQIICYTKSMSGSHLHFGIKTKNGKNPTPYLMDYMPRTDIYNTRYPSIANLWFKYGKIDWNLPVFKDLSLESNNMTYPKRGQRIEWLKDVNIKPGQDTDCSKDSRCKLAKVGSVGEILSDEVRTSGRYQYMDVRMLNAQGWSRVAYNQQNHNYFKVTTKPMTGTDGNTPDPVPTCEQKLAAEVIAHKRTEVTLDAAQRVIEIKDKEINTFTEQMKKMEEDFAKERVEYEEKIENQTTEIRKLLDKLDDCKGEKSDLEKALEKCEGDKNGCLPFGKFFKKPDDPLPSVETATNTAKTD